MSRQALIDAPPFGLSQDEKAPLFRATIDDLTRYHADHCDGYRRIVEGAFPSAHRARDDLAQAAFLPVGLFKSHDLRSISDAELFKTVASSGTTTGRPSRIVLDRAAAALQAGVLAKLLSTVVGPKRLPMLVVDSPPGGGPAIDARYAATVGVMPLGRDALFCFDDRMQIREEALSVWLREHPGPKLVFGFTFVVWSWLQGLGAVEIDLSESILLHTGGWKKLQDVSVAPAVYKATLRSRTGLQRVHNFYGMAEQVGTVFLECEQGVLHAPALADVIVRDELAWQPVAPGGSGVIQSLSVLPTSYPGHSILTEDLGTLVARDGCACGRRGTAFRVLGRVPRAELRGCSDTRS